MTGLQVPAFIIALASLGAGKASAQGLELTVENVGNEHGKIVVRIFDNADTFDYLAHECAFRYAVLPTRWGRVSHRFADLTSSPYTVFVFHDEDLNWDVDHDGRRLLEGVEASSAPNPQDMPDFHAASIKPGPRKVTVHHDGS